MNCEKLRSLDSSVLILVISAWSTQASLFSAIKAGATGYVLKERDDAEVRLSIQHFAAAHPLILLLHKKF